MDDHKRHYDIKGWTHFKNIVPQPHIDLARDLGLELRYWRHEIETGTPCKFGPEYHSDFPIVPCAAMYEKDLNIVYKSEKMYDIASKLLDTDDVWLFNDQMVYKLPNDGMSFVSHYDNQFGPFPDGSITTINCCIILDDIDQQNGGLSVKNRDNGKWVKLSPKAGDIVCIDGDTLHKSGENRSDSPRGLYACVYSKAPIHFQQYYKERFILL